MTHVMVEGGPATALSFLKAGLIDRVILVRATTVTFANPVPSGLSDEVFEGSGLERVGAYELDVDSVECWSKGGLPWPTKDPESWP